MFFNLFFILQLVLRILHVLLQILTQSTPNSHSQQIKPINLVNKPIQIKPRSKNQSQQTQKNTNKPKIKPRSHHHWPTQSNHHHPTTSPTKPKTHPTEPVVVPPYGQGGPRTTLTWKKNFIYNNLKFYI